MKILRFFLSLGILFIFLFNSSCKDSNHKTTSNENIVLTNQNLFIETLQKHLDAVSNKDLESLKETMHPNGKMQLILPSAEIMYTFEDFIMYHEDWFSMPNWSFETKIISSNVGEKLGVATTEIIYREPERDGKPYFNRMNVSYVLEKTNNSWYVIKDHASSIEKSTDKE